MKTTKVLLTMLCLWFGLMPSVAQSVTITKELEINPLASAIAMFKNQFGKWEKPDMNDTFPYAVIRMRLEGNETEVRKAKERLTLYMGQFTAVVDRYTENSNEILFLVPARRPSIYIDCGDGCEQVLLIENQQLRSNGVYYCTVHYQQSKEVIALEEEIALLKQRLEQLENTEIQKEEEVEKEESNELQFIANGAPFTMIKVAGGTVESLFHNTDSIVLPDYYIGQTEVTQELWYSVMGYNPSHFPYSLKHPIENINKNEITEFIYRLNIMTGENFYIPSQAEWIYAASGGNTNSKGVNSGREDLFFTAWFDNNSSSSSQAVAKKEPNSLGIYDMSGNVAEWCYSDVKTYYALGGSWEASREDCALTVKNKPIAENTKLPSIGLRLVLHPKTKQTDEGLKGRFAARDSSYVFQIGDIYFDMKYVEGGTFMMGQPENEKPAKKNERPIHEVTLSDYYIGETEVTEQLWNLVMDNNNTQDYLIKPKCTNYYDCLNFIIKLNAMTGKTFRLPTEAEWEYAARGGKRSHDYQYAGSHDIHVVAVYSGNSTSLRPVKQKLPNELGLYDMTGNLREWCHDYYNLYNSEAQTNPIGHVYNEQRVLRGGSWADNQSLCRITTRKNTDPNRNDFTHGFRIVLIPDTY